MYFSKTFDRIKHLLQGCCMEKTSSSWSSSWDGEADNDAGIILANRTPSYSLLDEVPFYSFYFNLTLHTSFSSSTGSPKPDLNGGVGRYRKYPGSIATYPRSGVLDGD